VTKKVEKERRTIEGHEWLYALYKPADTSKTVRDRDIVTQNNSSDIWHVLWLTAPVHQQRRTTR